jgi:hypothetical protein
MDIPDGRGDVYADILQILAHRSGQLHMMSIQTLCDYYFPSRPDSLVIQCVEEMHQGDFPISCPDEKVVRLTDKDKAVQIIKEIRGGIYGDSTTE